MAKYYNNRKSETTSVGDAISDLLKQYHLQERFDENRLIHSWKKLMGATIANRTSKIFIKNKVLFIELTSAPLKKELSMSKAKIVSIFEKEIGKDIIKEIIFM
ncbi:DUF721 domain-containing protein [Fulvivirga lutimaris]|uniref:DUF721 domain-containing protein n=1 Tax=Fulvivirga lutimaris TaxID=1819566 RepID=UPI0012BC0AA6|nr:DUF721 domain-containing protein [Fulvivirga lutimaris]MTI40379.1 DUF721 domain-containing protein [Fulvivirga lutimaris]